MRYRAEIDGLRALAVVPVILFHAGFSLFGGGFVGVDVFFVISGYLITTIIYSELENGNFSIVRFYERRARRILPALFLVMGACLPFAWQWFSPSDLRAFNQSLIAVTLFISNIFFWKQSGYFDTANEFKPLLHTWSLAVEEQYYVIFPVLLAMTWRFGRRRIIQALVLITIASLAIAQWGSSVKPAATFYLLPTRSWELLIGALVAFYFCNDKKFLLNKTVNEIGSSTGLILLVLAIFTLDKKTPFPSLYALLPTMGTALIILCANQENMVGRLLSHRIPVGIGLVSYSAYLWHQPLFAFVRYRSVDEPSRLFMGVLIILTGVLAFLSWKYVEAPFRSKKHFSRNRIFSYGLAGSLCFAAFGLITNLVQPNPAEQLSANQSTYPGPPKVLILGDSHAGHLEFGMKKEFGGMVITRTFPGCIPFYNVDRYDSRFAPGDCVKNINKSLADFERSEHFKTIILSTMGPVYLDKTAFKGKDEARVTGLHVLLVDDESITDHWKVFEIGMRRTLARLTSIPGKKVIFLIDVPELGIEPRLCGAPKDHWTVLGTRFGVGPSSFDNCFVSRKDYDDRAIRYRNFIREILVDFPQVTLFDPTGLFCDAQKCLGVLDGKKLYGDVDHLSDFGSAYLAKHLSPVVLDTLK